MTRYHFIVEDGGARFVDDEGEEFINVDALRAVAVRTLGEMLRSGVAPEFWSGTSWTLSARDAQEQVVLAITVSAAPGKELTDKLDYQPGVTPLIQESAPTE
jgi:hypothetical protein